MATPFLTRFYPPEIIGVWQLFVGAVLILDAVATCRFEIAIPLPKSDRKGGEVFWLCCLVTLIVAVLSLSAYLTLGQHLPGFDPRCPYWLLSVTLLGLGWEHAGNYWLVRQKRVAVIGISGLGKSLVLGLMPLLAAIAGYGTVTTLIWTTVVSQWVATLLQGVAVLRDPALLSWRKVHPSRLLSLVSEFRAYPLWMMPYGFVAQGVRRALLFLLLIYTSQHDVGLFALVMQVALIPVALLSQSMSQVLFPRMASGIADGTLEPLVYRLLALVGLASVPWCVVSMFFANDLAPLLLGEAWKDAGQVLGMAVPCAFLLLQTSWLIRIYDVRGQQRRALFWQVSSDLVSMLVFWWALWATREASIGIYVYCVFVTVYNFVWLLFTLRLAGFSLKPLATIYGMIVLLGGGAYFLCLIFANASAQVSQAVFLAISCLLIQGMAIFHWRRVPVHESAVRSLEAILGKADNTVAL